GAKATAAEITDDIWKSYAYADIAEVQAKAGDIAEALDAVKLITSGYKRDQAYSSIAAAQARAGDIAGALETAARIKDQDYNTAYDAYRDIAKAKAKPGSETKAWTIFATAYQQKLSHTDLQGFLASLKGKDPDDVFEALTRAFEKIGIALRELQDNEVKWQELRAKSAP
ncbi:MAG: hypothetical protein J3T61_11020, partial [Candidatus Brocadiales bacterium]|nr:hypothetical protein [Candidatus Bathyanammoxibius sp.]